MHILYLHQYFRTPAEGGALRSYYISQALVQAGHKVTVITAHNKPGYELQMVDGVEVHYLPVPYSNAFGATRRVLAFARYMWSSFRLALKQKNIDVIYATSTPLTVGITALALHWLRKKPYVFEVRDLWPEAPIQLGYIRNRFLIGLLHWLEKIIYRHAAHIVTLSPGMQAGVQKVVPGKPVSMLPNMSDTAFYSPAPKPETYGGLQVANHFVVSYTGALGRANRVSFLLDLAEVCAAAGLHKIIFLIAGTGAEEHKLKQDSLARELQHVFFLGSLNRIGIRDLLAASDATYTSFDKVPVLETNSPNKFFDSLAAGRICLVNTEGWLKELLEKNRCGFYCDPLRPETALPHLRQLLSDPALRQLYQHNARQLAEREFSREQITGQVVALIEKIGNQQCAQRN